MQKLSGSIGQITDSLTPFERAEYNVAKFAINIRSSHELNELLDRLQFLNSMKSIASFVDTPDGDTFESGVEDYSYVVDKEIASLELAIRIYCEAYSKSMEA